MEYEVFMFFVSFLLSISFITMFAACICCRKKIPKNDLLGLEGMVKLKNPEENLSNNEITEVITDTKQFIPEVESKRASNAPHRSLPDIPISEPLAGDTGSDLYATVGDKVIEKPQGRSPGAVENKKLASVSQHSSLSQADDVSSPYARVRSPPHAYDKVKPAEHPYARVKAGSSSSTHFNQQQNYNMPNDASSSRHSSNQSLAENVIPAASAIAGRISASQELPYMTPPIVQQHQHFSGDSQDSSKGYTSISVREPLANIIAQTNQQNAQTRRINLAGSHYATVSDDSDEMYAAIEDPNNPVDLYTSGSETYAQIQPPTAMTVAVEINPIPSSIKQQEDEAAAIPNSIPSTPQRLSVVSVNPDDEPTPLPPVEILRTVHSRQASSSSCTSSVGNLGSPKPEKRQANSPLPPTPKNAHYLSNSNLTNSTTASSGRNSAASVIECQLPIAAGTSSRHVSRENLAAGESNAKITIRLTEKSDDDKTWKKSKDLEGMYAKVMKKTKLSNVPSQNNSPVVQRKSLLDAAMDKQPSDVLPNDKYPSEALSKSTNSPSLLVDNNYETIYKRRPRSNSFDVKEPGYETIPADKNNINKSNIDNTISYDKKRSSAPIGALEHGTEKIDISSNPTINKIPTEGPDYEILPEPKTIDPGYETVQPSGSVSVKAPNSDYDPNYEVLRPTDHGNELYSKIWEQPKEENNDGYSSIKSSNKTPISNLPLYNTVNADQLQNHDYASISEHNKITFLNNNIDGNVDKMYESLIDDQHQPAAYDNEHHNYSTISESNESSKASASNKVTNNDFIINKVMTSSGYSTISETKTTPSSESNSSDNQISYNSIRSNNNDTTLNLSTYESLTGSESDPNYESVRYTSVIENPYERLQNDCTTSPTTDASSQLLIDKNQDNLLNKSTSNSNNDSSSNQEVGDYFQV